MPKELDIYTVIGSIIAIALAILSPSIPAISTAIGPIAWLSFFIILIVIVFLINWYLNTKNEKAILERKIIEIINQNKEIKNELIFLKERFKTLEDFAEVKARISLLEKKR